MKLLFKKAEPSDIPVIAQLADKIWKKHYPSIITMSQVTYMLDRMYSPPSIQQQMSDGHEFTIVYEGNEALAYASLSRNGNNYFLHKFYVDTEKHGKGIGQHLYNYLISKLENLQSIELTVNRQNIKAINFYFKMGFVIDRIADFDIGDGYFMNDFVMIRKF